MNRMRINGFFERFTHLMPLWVVIAGMVGLFKPSLYYPFKPCTEWLFAFTMLGIGAVLNFDDFLPVLKKPHLVILGTLSQFAIMPLFGYIIAIALNMPKELFIGMIMTGSAPGAMASNVISYLAKADVAYSIALTSTSTFLSPLLTPALVYILAHSVIEVSLLQMAVSIVKMVIIPLAVGFTMKRAFGRRIEGMISFFPAFSTLFIAFICGLVVALNQQYILRISSLVFAGVFLLNLSGLLLGYGAGKVYGFDTRRRRTLSFEVGMQNAGMGAVLSLKFFSPQSALVSALFATWCVITASILAEIWSRKNPD